LLGLNLTESDRLRIVEAVKNFSGDDLSRAALWRETTREQRRWPGAKTTNNGIHFDPRLLKALRNSENDYLAFIVLHEMSHVVHHDIDSHAKGSDELEQEVRASADARDALVEHGVLSKSKAERLVHTWWRDFLHPETAPLFRRMERLQPHHQVTSRRKDKRSNKELR
jgi:hypothetical protein